MVYITSWDEFVDRSVQLFRADPESGQNKSKHIVLLQFLLRFRNSIVQFDSNPKISEL
ncbi:hypothetical protein SLEP1_g899 [Rubroshorea leprosula]|uniref:Uncharacterized protein n=1 Tax=Rubroshorea leprosula TaxID=152421 RepID=A0AAV5HC31_9ROSI|nr:hypothetical protein SLEP1_g899 [Rubroshorea leprosula]